MIKGSIVLLALVVFAACAAPTPTTLPAATRSAATPVRAEAISGQFQLVFELPTADWHTADSITGLATLSYTGMGEGTIGASGMGPISFKFREVDGSRHMDGLSTSDLVIYPISAVMPITSPIKKSVSFGADDPNARFYESFFHDPLNHLPVGDWTITAAANFSDGNSSPHSLEVTVRVHVTP